MSARCRRPLQVAALATLATLAGGAAVFVDGPAQAASTQVAPTPVAPAGSTGNPFAPSYGHAYRHGAVPTRSSLARMKQYQAQHPPAAAASQLAYHGGEGGVGVTTGHERVYLVFFGSQWGTKGTDAKGYTTLSGDPAGVAPRIQALFKGLGTNGETWSGVMTQYCQGVAMNATRCPSTNTAHVAYPTGGALAGVWVDDASRSPAAATQKQLIAETLAAAAHFGNTTATANRNAQYVILSPQGTHPDGFITTGGFCAWHAWAHPNMLSGGAAPRVTGGMPYTNLPYLPDAGAGCFQNWVNPGPAGLLDGVTMVGGHEYAETVTDPQPESGWADYTSGQENADKCDAEASSNVTFATGTFAMQQTWANDRSGCAISHPIVRNASRCSSARAPLGNPGFESGAKVWTQSTGVISNSTRQPTHAGSYDAWLDGYGSSHTDTLSQRVTLPAGCKAYTLRFYLHVDTAETSGKAQDTLTVSAGGKVLATYSNLDQKPGYVRRSLDLRGYAGKTVTLTFSGTENRSLQTSFVIDDTAVVMS